MTAKEITIKTAEENVFNSEWWNLIFKCLHQYGGCYEPLQNLQRATEFKRSVPASFIRETQYTSIFDIGPLKDQARELRDVLIKEFVNAILNLTSTSESYKKELLPDDYFRLFHVLTLLNVPKNTEMLPRERTPDNYSYSCAYWLWQADDGTEEMFKNLNTAAWFAAEQIKKTK